MAASREMYLDKSGKIIKNLSLIGYRAAGVPGSVAGLWEAHHRFGKLPWKDVVEPARMLAVGGFNVSFAFANSLKANSAKFKQFPESYLVFNRGGKLYGWGETFKQPELALTLERIRDGGAKDFYTGKTAKLIAADMKAHGGLITMADLARYKPITRKPVVGSYRGYSILTMPPPSSGGVALIEMLNVLQGWDLKAAGWNSSRSNHLMVETMKRAFADRAELMGDPAFVQVPVASLTSSAYANVLRGQISLSRATPSSEIHAGAPAKEGNNTTHYTVVDGQGNAVATTTTLNMAFGSLAVVKGAGFLLNDEMDDFTSKVGEPNGFGLIQGSANAIAPGKRPLSSMTPTVVLHNGKLFMALGSPGGPTIINTVLQTIVNVIDFGMGVQEAVSAPRMHHQWLRDEIAFEPRRFSPEGRLALEGLGHKFAKKPALMGSCNAILVDPVTGFRFGGVDPRVEGAGAAGH